MKRSLALGLLLLGVFGLIGVILADYYRAPPDKLEPKYVGRDSCIQCHQTQASLFVGSDHDLAMDLATSETVLASFDNQKLEHDGLESTMYRDGDRFMVRTDGPDGELHDYQVKYVFGVRPLQQYMVELDRPDDASGDEIGRVQVLRESWDTNKKSWFYLMPPDVNEYIEPTDPLHWTGITQNWNSSCANCHSTDVHKNFNPISGHYRTTFSEIDVSCEACHGPGEYHVTLARRRSLFWDRKHGYGLAKLKVESNVPQVETCAPCHSRRSALTESYRPGCNFDDYFATQLVAAPIYHVDGQIRDEDYVYGSFIQSKMYHNGIKCSDCHDPHSDKVKFANNMLCTSCHQHPSGKYDTPNHHHHAVGTPGSNCVDCHMPATTYMMVDSRRDHSFRVPRPDMSLQFGTPNACTGCHLDPARIANRESEKPLTQYLDWIIAAEEGDAIVKTELQRVNTLMQDAVNSWYPVGQSAEKTEYYEWIAQGLSGGEEAAPTLVKLANDRAAPAMLRASALAELSGDASIGSLEAAQKALEDANPKVIIAGLYRFDAEISRTADRLRYAQSPGDITRQFQSVAEPVVQLLSHPSLRVRTEAARILANLDPQSRQAATNARQRKDFALAIAEFEAALRVSNDRVSSHMMLGGLHEMLRDPDAAKNDYRTAISVEPSVAGPRSNLAALLDSELVAMQQRMQSSQSSGIEAGQLKSMLGQMQGLRTQIMRLRAEEHELLAADIRRSEGLPDTHGLHYRFGMSSYLQQDFEAVEKHLKIAWQQQPDNPTYLLGLATYYLQFEQPAEALNYIQRLVQLDPQHPGYQNLLIQAQAMSASSTDQEED